MGNKLLKASFGVTLVMLVGNLLSFVKEATIANYFGVSAEVDAYAIAIQIPVLLFSFISVAVQSVVIPIFSDIYYKQSEQEAKKYVDNLITMLFFGTVLMAVVGVLLASPIVYLFAPGFEASTHELSVTLLRVTFPSIIFGIICQVLIAVLNVHKQFVANSFAIYFTNVTIIVCVILLNGKFGIAAACIGQLLGDGLRCAFVVFLARRFYNYNLGLNFRHPDVLKTLKKSVPVLWSMSVAETNAIVNRMVGSFLFAGSISAISYSSKVNSVLLQLFVSAIATIVYPLYAESSAKGDIVQLNRRVNSTISAYSLFVVPLAFGLIVFRKEVIELAFGRGAFNQDAIELTQGLLGIYAIGMLFMAFRSTLNNVFYSMKDTKTPAVNASVGALLNIVLNITLPQFLGVKGIALSSTITAVYITSSLMWNMMKKFEAIDMKVFFTNIRRIVLSGVIMLVAICLFHHFMNGLNTLLMFSLGGLLAVIIYSICVIAFRVPVAIQIINMLISKKK